VLSTSGKRSARWARGRAVDMRGSEGGRRPALGP
jgi:hypothetical protein